MWNMSQPPSLAAHTQLIHPHATKFGCWLWARCQRPQCNAIWQSKQSTICTLQIALGRFPTVMQLHGIGIACIETWTVLVLLNDTSPQTLLLRDRQSSVRSCFEDPQLSCDRAMRAQRCDSNMWDC